MPRVMGLPVPLIVVGLVLSVSMGMMLSKALELSTTGTDSIGSGSIDASGGPGKNSAGLPVISESTLGIEVQRLLDSGTVLASTASFDVQRCLDEQSITVNKILTMEEVAWGPDGSRAWLIIHGPVDRESLRANGGVVDAIVVLPSCGLGSPDSGPSNRLWAGSTMVGSV
ncbi:hypothetical protein [Brachybacterium hainanense]|uniref:Uncharacterized protein n=1 Tax=Brachybacterium hainanense TaxID=1541174 RepID=A0ABV6RD80_9MICO